MKTIDRTGKRFGRLVAVAPASGHQRPRGHVDAYWTCRCDCGQEKEISVGNLTSGNTKSCGCLRKESSAARCHGAVGVKHPRWRGGQHKTADGYVRLLRSAFPGLEKSRARYILEHVVVMTRYLGRSLHKGETIHHKNGIRDDNDLKNLELRASNHGPGQRAEDLVVWAKEILARYDAPTVSPCCV